MEYEKNRTVRTRSKSIVTIVLVIIFWMALWEMIGLLTNTLEKHMRLFFYGTVLFCLTIFVSIRTDLIPHF